MLIRSRRTKTSIQGGTMPQRGDIVVERLTGKRAIVIHVTGPEEVTCRFADGRLEDRYTFELDPWMPFLNWLMSLVMSISLSTPRERPASAVNERVRPLLVRPSNAS